MWYNSGSYPPGSALVGTEEFFGYQNGDKRFTASQFRDFCNSTVPIPGALKDFKTYCNAVGDGVADDTAAFLTACTNGGAYWLDPQYKFRIDAGNVPAANVAFVGAGIRDRPFGQEGFGKHGSQIYLTGTTNSPFIMSGNNVTFSGINFLWPNQVNQPSGPIIYPPLITGTASGLSQLIVHDCQITNAFDAFYFPNGFGFSSFTNCEIYAIRYVWWLNNVPAEVYINNCDITFGAYGPEVGNFSGYGSGAVFSNTSSGSTPSNSTTISFVSVAGFEVNQVIRPVGSGTTAIPASTYITAINGNVVTLSAATTDIIPSGTVIQFQGYYLRNYTANYGAVWYATGNGTPTSLSTTNGAGALGVQVSNCYIHGYKYGILAQGAWITLCNFSNVSFETESVIWVDTGSTAFVSIVGGIQFLDYHGLPNFSGPSGVGYYFSQLSPGSGITPPNRVSIRNVAIGHAQGRIAYAFGPNVGELVFDSCSLRNFGRFNSGPNPVWAFDVTAPGCTLSIRNNQLWTQLGTVDDDGSVIANNGIRITAAGSAIISGNQMQQLAIPLDIEDPTTMTVIDGNMVTSTTGNNRSIVLGANGNAAPTFVNVDGTPTPGDSLSITVTSLQVVGSPITVSYTIQSTDILISQTAAWLGVAFNANSALSNAGLMAAFANGRLVLYNINNITVSYEVNVVGSTETITMNPAPSQPIPSNVAISGNQFDEPLLPYEIITPTEGGSYSMANLWGDRTLTRLTPAGALNAITVAFPPSPADGEIRTLASTQTINSVTLTGTLLAGSSTVPLSADQSHSWQYIGSASGWQPLY